MSLFNAQQLLTSLAAEYRQEKESFSREEIIKRINEVKYLSSQKKIPRLSLRKEIIHLENKLQSIFELEKKLAAHTKMESAKVTVLKRQIKLLQQKLALVEEKDFQKKADTLSHLLGEYLARKTTEEDIAFRKKVMKELGMKRIIPKKRSNAAVVPVPEAKRFYALQQRLQLIKEQLEEHRQLGKIGIVGELEPKIAALEEKLNEHGIASMPMAQEKSSQEVPPVEKKMVKHTLLFGKPPISDEDEELEKALPLPPPPRMKA